MKDFLDGKKIRLRAPEPEDLSLLYQWENRTENWLLGETIAPFSKNILQQYLEQAHEDFWASRQLRLMIERKDPEETVGTLDLFDFDPLHQRAGVGILIAERSQRRQGIGLESLRLLIDYARDRLGLHQLYCHIPANNLASQRLFAKAGFCKTGRNLEWVRIGSRWEDVCFFQLILNTSSPDK